MLSALIFNLLQIKAINPGWGAVWKGFWRRWGVGSVPRGQKANALWRLPPIPARTTFRPQLRSRGCHQPLRHRLCHCWAWWQKFPELHVEKKPLTSQFSFKEARENWVAKMRKTKAVACEGNWKTGVCIWGRNCCMASALKSYQGSEQLTKIVKTLWKCTNRPVTHWGGVLPKQIVKYFNKDCVHQGRHGLPDWYS